MTQIHVQRKCAVDAPDKKRSRFWEFCENFGFAVIVLTFAVVIAMLLQQAGVTLEPVHPR
ncbi:hypothetical protein [Aporhodopirellula aestuarii]|uniref:Uncharacterized protein n=1 Tax=Aporhodopirellula aestuarii TaxID=2950107 RepID=A0ABT0U597_9BACT|nr:hypothetical protein [Aporhodopirellula aestuarii]MCM2372078.1 hypothetical protein [Aporhodopirellula aestuarii]